MEYDVIATFPGFETTKEAREFQERLHIWFELNDPAGAQGMHSTIKREPAAMAKAED